MKELLHLRIVIRAEYDNNQMTVMDTGRLSATTIAEITADGLVALFVRDLQSLGIVGVVTTMGAANGPALPKGTDPA